MVETKAFETRIFLRGAFGALLAAVVVHVVLWKTKFISPLGTVVVPLLTFGVTTILAYLHVRNRSKN